MGQDFMRYTNYFLTILVMHGCLLAMDDPAQLPKGKKGIFLKEIVCAYQNPVRISQMTLENEGYGTTLSCKKIPQKCI